MIIDEFKSDSTLIRIDDRDIQDKEKSRELIKSIIEICIKKIQNVCK